MNLKKLWKQVWHFIWEDNSIWSWLVNIVLAFVIIKFLVYPGLGLMLATSHPVVAVVSESMDHGIEANELGQLNLCGQVYEKKQSVSPDEYWNTCGQWYESNFNITQEEFKKYKLSRGFSKGDLIILKGVMPKDVKVGDIIVFQTKRPDPIIHRVVDKWQENGNYFFQTKGDHNSGSIKNSQMDETKVAEQQVIGRAVVKIPLLGWVKILFVSLMQFIGGLF